MWGGRELSRMGCQGDRQEVLASSTPTGQMGRLRLAEKGLPGHAARKGAGVCM